VNWYKMAEAAVTVTPAEFGAMTREEKIVLARNPSISPDTQRLFFTEDYEWKNQAIKNLAFNEGIAPATQLLFFTEQYKDKDKALWNLAENHSFLRGEFTPGQWLQIKKAARGSMRLLVLSKRLKQIAGVS